MVALPVAAGIGCGEGTRADGAQGRGALNYQRKESLATTLNTSHALIKSLILVISN